MRLWQNQAGMAEEGHFHQLEQWPLPVASLRRKTANEDWNRTSSFRNIVLGRRVQANGQRRKVAGSHYTGHM